METYKPVEVSPFEPTAEQLTRDKALRRFNRLYIYLPIGIFSAIIIVIITLILIGIFHPRIVGTEEFISALADIILILWLVPLVIVLALVPIGYAAYLSNRRKKRKQSPQTGPLAYRSRVQILLWRLQVMLDRIHDKTEETAPALAEPIINFNSFLTYWESWLNILTKQIFGSGDHDRDGNGN